MEEAEAERALAWSAEASLVVIEQQHLLTQPVTRLAAPHHKLFSPARLLVAVPFRFMVVLVADLGRNSSLQCPWGWECRLLVAAPQNLYD